MTTLATIRSRVRQDLNDEDQTNLRWTDAHLDRHIGHAVREYSTWNPVQRTTTIATTAGSREVTLDPATFAGLIRIERVEYPVGCYPPEWPPFDVWGGTILLRTDVVPVGDDCRVLWLQAHTLDATTSTVPTEHEDLIAIGATAYAALEWASYATNRLNVDPRAVEHYESFGRQRLAEFKAGLAALPTVRRLRGRGLFPWTV